MNLSKISDKSLFFTGLLFSIPVFVTKLVQLVSNINIPELIIDISVFLTGIGACIFFALSLRHFIRFIAMIVVEEIKNNKLL